MVKNRGEVIVVSLTPMQIAIIAVCSILLLTFSFLFGLRIGKRQPAADMSIEAEMTTEAEPLSATEPLSSESEPATMKGELTFTEKLTEKDVPLASNPVPTRVQEASSSPVRPASQEKYEKYTLQVGSFKRESDARRFATQLSESGYFTYVEDADLGEKGTWYRVKLGGFPTVDEAKQTRDALLKEHGQKSFVVAK